MSLAEEAAAGGSAAAIGRSVPRADAAEKACGKALYSADAHGAEFLLAAVRRAGVPSARLVAVRTGRAAAVPGVVAVLTHRDVKGTNRQGIVRHDEPVLVDGRVRHAGDPVVLVVAEGERALAEALALVEVDLEPLPALFDPDLARAPGTPVLHEDHPGGNVLLEAELVLGEGEAAAASCDAVATVTLSTPRQEHACLETESGWAIVRGDGTLEMTCSTQTPWRDRLEVAAALGLDPARVRVAAPWLGGGFGGKDGITVQSLLGLAALASAGRPVRMRWGREESFVASPKRQASRVTATLGASAGGTFRFFGARILLDVGPYDHLAGAVLELALEHATGPYRIPNVSLKAEAVYTNNPPGGPFRGFGVTQVAAAVEQLVDLVADRLGMDRLEIRRVNAIRQGDVAGAGFTLSCSAGLDQCLDRLAAHPAWTSREEWKRGAGPFKRRGAGVAALWHGAGYGPVIPDVANARVTLAPEGRLRVDSGVVDMGQGNGATAARIAGLLLAQPPSSIDLVHPDTAVTLPSGSSAASRTTYTYGNALAGAATELARRLRAKGALLLAAPEGEVDLVPGGVRHALSDRLVPLAPLAASLSPDERTSVFRWQAPTARDGPIVPEALRLHGFPHYLFSFGAHLALVEVDELTGAVDVVRYVAVSECGRVLDPKVLAQQIHGAVAQGLGLALTEELLVTDGVILNPGLATYLLPTALDIPDVESITVEAPESTGPFGLKGAGEIAVNGPVPAVANAVADACGIRFDRIPLTPERVLAAMHGGTP